MSADGTKRSWTPGDADLDSKDKFVELAPRVEGMEEDCQPMATAPRETKKRKANSGTDGTSNDESTSPQEMNGDACQQSKKKKSHETKEIIESAQEVESQISSHRETSQGGSCDEGKSTGVSNPSGTGRVISGDNDGDQEAKREGSAERKREKQIGEKGEDIGEDDSEDAKAHQASDTDENAADLFDESGTKQVLESKREVASVRCAENTVDSGEVSDVGQEAKSTETRDESLQSKRLKTDHTDSVPQGRDKETSEVPNKEPKSHRERSNDATPTSTDKSMDEASSSAQLNKQKRDKSRPDVPQNDKTAENLSISPLAFRSESDSAMPKAPRLLAAPNSSTPSQKKKSPGTSLLGSGSAAAASGGIDAHPFPRGNVIEVLHYPNNSVREDYGLDDGDDDDDDDEQTPGAVEGGVSKSRVSGSSNGSPTIRLCDIIDRAPVPTARPNDPPARRWRYYVHYRDFNRRMDEWVTSERIVSPPSVGNAKVRALKKRREEDEKRMAAERAVAADRAAATSSRKEFGPSAGSVLSGQGTNAADDEGLSRKKRRRSAEIGSVAAAAGTVASAGSAATAGTSTYQEGRQRAVRASSRRASTAITASSGGAPEGKEDEGADCEGEATTTEGSLGIGVGSSGTPPSSTPSQAGASAQRLTRRQRRKAPDIAAGGSGSIMLPVGARDLHDDAPRIGVDVVATVPAQDLDEHEGLDEASLREHEEVTKVKNVAQLELGQYRMDTWYFSPIPKELLKENGMIDVLYVCEFTLNFFTRKEELLRFHAKQLPKDKRHPPGNEIYRNGNLSS